MNKKRSLLLLVMSLAKYTFREFRYTFGESHNLSFCHQKRSRNLTVVSFAQYYFGESPLLIYRISVIFYFLYKNHPLILNLLWSSLGTLLEIISKLTFCEQEKVSVHYLLYCSLVHFLGIPILLC